MPPVGRHRLGTRAHGHRLRRVRRRSADAVGIGHHEARFVGGVRLEIQDAAGEHVRRDQVEDVALVDACSPCRRDQRHRRSPGGLALLAVRDLDAGIAIGVAVDVPFEAEVDERRVLDDELAGRDLRVALRRDGRVGEPRGERDRQQSTRPMQQAEYAHGPAIIRERNGKVPFLRIYMRRETYEEWKPTPQQIARGIVQIGCVTALAMVLKVALPQAAHADRVAPPYVPDQLQVLAPNKAFLVGHAGGDRRTMCACPPVGPSPGHCLLRRRRSSTTTASTSPRTSSVPPVRRTIPSAPRGSSGIRARSGRGDRLRRFHHRPEFVKPGAVAWLKLAFAGFQDGPLGGDRLTGTTFVQRVNLSAGSAPSTGCAAAGDVGRRRLVPYRADYSFYRDARVVSA